MTKKNPKKTPATKPAKTEAAPKKAKQLKLPADGMSRKAIPELDNAAEKYREARDTRMGHTQLEKAAKTVLLEVAKKFGVKVYVYESEDGEELEVEYIAKTDENVKVKKVKAEKDDEE